MKLLHVSDWHLGRMTYNQPRAEDHDKVLAEIVSLARRENPDLICHTGDLFDSVRPGYEEMKRGLDALQELAALAPVVVVCGNHDSPALFRLFDQLLGPRSSIRFVDSARAPEDGGLLHFSSVDGERIRLAPLPFIHANRMVEAFEDSATWMTTYAERIQKIERSLDRGLKKGYNPATDILLFAAHLFVGGATFSRSERPIHISDSYATRLEHLPSVSYAAFGHIHKPQALPTTTVTGRYAGSPIPLDFGEEGESKVAVLVEARPGRAARVTTAPLSGGRPLRRFEGTIDELRAAAERIKRDLCLLTIRTEVPAIGLAEQVRDILPEATFLQINEACAANRTEVLTARDLPATGTEPGFKEMFHDYLVAGGTRGATVDGVLRTFEALIEAVEGEQVATFAEEALLAPLDTGPTPTPATSERSRT